jgi:hypothetical protein
LDLLAKIDYTLDKVATTGAWEGSGETAAGSPKGETSGSERVNCCRKSKTQSILNPLTENYNYDAVDQLIEAKYGTARTVGYQFDAVGNRQWVSDNGTTEHYTANPDNGYTSVDGGTGGQCSFSFKIHLKIRLRHQINQHAEPINERK